MIKTLYAVWVTKYAAWPPEFVYSHKFFSPSSRRHKMWYTLNPR
ncbi:hypothetical protein EAI72_16795 [Escherichia coli]|nr:hypothetical protein EAI72_16795 [Escherichia coli]